ncbi:RNA polymerase sigma-70 factor, ECF subfamily [Mucilaginibacter sp. OK268]|jgi:RNA polymerase sigma-70 factor (ECF subfamily)|uniref:RNA polymerase sigma factor n=1 Tax=Mucilaginibacter sp. OK268 TaxID=1881048 RepID=UPI00088576BB|nr:RNA polymerase sigma-70 factor [Mucilaginibacter sp. OK268]SDP44983.1 RNA polymerase sigma-70 factor, ECF subfamily [Mucilaginibacter sp. OK268]
MGTYTDLSDDKLVALLKQGNEQALKEIFTRYNKLLYSYAYKKLEDQEEAKDLVQDLFIRLWSNRESFVLKTSLPSYLFRAVRNRALDIFAHKKIKSDYVASFQAFIDLPQSTTDYLVREKDISALIDREIQSLPPKMREIFILSRKENYSHKEIAKKIGISEETVTKQIKRALKILRLRLKLILIIAFLLSE